MMEASKCLIPPALRKDSAPTRQRRAVGAITSYSLSRNDSEFTCQRRSVQRALVFQSSSKN